MTDMMETAARMSSGRTEGLVVRDLWQGYGTDPILRGIDVAFQPGKFTAILGPNGCGKSTLLKSLSGLLTVTQGTVTLDGVPTKTFSTKALAREISSLAQGAVAPEGLSVRDLVSQGRYPHRGMFGNWRETDQAAIDQAMALTAISDLAERNLSELSGGQRQRAWIAMTLAQQGRILLLDEPTTFLDPAHQLEVLTLVRRLVSDTSATVVAVLHDLNHAAQFADHIVFLKDGLKICEGSPAEVMTAKVLEGVFGLKVAFLNHPQTGAPICVPWFE